MQRLRMVLLVAMAVVGLATACEKKDEAVCGSTATGCGRTIGTCCSSTQCYYTYNGARYNCSGTNCQSAAAQVVRAACGVAPEPAVARDVAGLLSASQALSAASCPAPLP